MTELDYIVHQIPFDHLTAMLATLDALDSRPRS